jgi:hypothetical protein
VGTLQSQCRVRPDAALVAAIEAILGSGTVEIVGAMESANAAGSRSASANGAPNGAARDPRAGKNAQDRLDVAAESVAAARSHG